MAKYKGRHNGQTRGQYQEAVLFHQTKGVDDTEKLYSAVVKFLNHYGRCTSDTRIYSEDCYADEIHGSFHIGGATVGLNATNVKHNEHPHIPKNFVQLRLASNDCLDDVVKYITKQFPVLKKLPPNSIY